MEGIAFAEVVVGGVEVVCLEVVTCPVEVDLGEVEGGGGSSSEGGADGEGTGVGKGVEDGFVWAGRGADALPVQPLVEKDALGIACLEMDAVVDVIFPGDEGFVLGRAGDMGRVFFFVLVEAFPVAGLMLFVKP